MEEDAKANTIRQICHLTDFGRWCRSAPCLTQVEEDGEEDEEEDDAAVQARLASGGLNFAAAGGRGAKSRKAGGGRGGGRGAGRGAGRGKK